MWLQQRVQNVVIYPHHVILSCWRCVAGKTGLGVETVQSVQPAPKIHQEVSEDSSPAWRAVFLGRLPNNCTDQETSTERMNTGKRQQTRRGGGSDFHWHPRTLVSRLLGHRVHRRSPASLCFQSAARVQDRQLFVCFAVLLVFRRLNNINMSDHCLGHTQQKVNSFKLFLLVDVGFDSRCRSFSSALSFSPSLTFIHPTIPLPPPYTLLHTFVLAAFLLFSFPFSPLLDIWPCHPVVFICTRNNF